MRAIGRKKIITWYLQNLLPSEKHWELRLSELSLKNQDTETNEKKLKPRPSEPMPG